MRNSGVISYAEDYVVIEKPFASTDWCKTHAWLMHFVNIAKYELVSHEHPGSWCFIIILFV